MILYQFLNPIWFRHFLFFHNLCSIKEFSVCCCDNPKNIFYRKTNGKYHFALIDINRLKLGKVPGIRMSMNAFSQLGIPADDFMKIIPLYAEQRGFDIEECIFFTLFSRLKWRKQRQFKNFVKSKLHF